jgi:hypothetical protein
MDSTGNVIIRRVLRFSLVLLNVSSFSATLADGQVHRPHVSGSEEIGKYSTSNLPILDLSQIRVLRSETAESPSESFRALRYNQLGDTQPHPLYDPSTGKVLVNERFVRHLSHDPLPVASSDLIVTGKIDSSAVHISSDGSMLYSTFLLSPNQWIKGKSIGANTISLERIGGVALFPDGKKRFIGESGVGIPEQGHNYLFFLKKIDGGSSFRIETGYCIDGSKIIALDRLGDDLESMDSKSIVQQVESKIAAGK